MCDSFRVIFFLFCVTHTHNNKIVELDVFSHSFASYRISVANQNLDVIFAFLFIVISFCVPPLNAMTQKKRVLLNGPLHKRKSTAESCILVLLILFFVFANQEKKAAEKINGLYSLSSVSFSLSFSKLKKRRRKMQWTRNKHNEETP